MSTSAEPTSLRSEPIRLQVLTNSRMATAKSCLRKCFYRYELCLAKETEARPLRFGSAAHKVRELVRKGVPVEQAINSACEGFAQDEDSQYDAWTVRALMTGWAWYWQEPTGSAIMSEVPWEMPLINPATGALSRTWKLAGKIDGIDRLSDGRIAVSECKTTSEDISPESAYWLRLRADQQIALYMLAAKTLGHDVQTVLYDVIRKPTIRPSLVPDLDANGLKIVIVDATGKRALNKNGSPRQTGGEGYTVKGHIETPQEFAERLLADIQERPEYYYQRREIPILDADLEELRWELWQQGQALRAAQLHNRWYRSVGRMTCDYCDYSDICLQHLTVDPANPPSGYVIMQDPNPELSE